MKTMRENNSLYLYQPGGDELAVIKITVVNDSGIPGRVSDLKDLLETEKSVSLLLQTESYPGHKNLHNGNKISL